MVALGRRFALPITLAGALVVVFVAVLLGVRHVVATVPVQPGISGCERLVAIDDRQECFADRISDDLSGSELSVARRLARIDEAMPARFSEDCHQAGHRIAQRLSARRGFDELAAVNAIATHDGSVCGTGVMHGLLSHAISSRSGDVAKFADPYCATMPSDRSEGNCIHGIGHGLEASPARRDRAVEQCLGLSAWIGACVHGVMMQRGPENGSGLTPADCKVEGQRIPDERAAHMCWRMVIGPGATQTSAPIDVVNACVRAAPDDSASAACGLNVSVPTERVRDCLQVTRIVAARACAFSAFANAAKPPEPSDLATCPPSLNASCAVGIGVRSQLDGARDAETTCDELEGTSAIACTVGAEDCWPTDPYDRVADRCLALQVRAGLTAEPWMPSVQASTTA